MNVSRACSTLMLLAACVTSFCTLAIAQRAPKGGSDRPREARKSSNSDLTSLEQAHNDALNTGNAETIASSSRALSLALLAHLQAKSEITGDRADQDRYESVSKLLQSSQAATTLQGQGLAQQQGAAATKRTAGARTDTERWELLLGQVLNDLGTAEARQGQFSTAQSVFQSATEFIPQDATLLRNLGTTAFRNEDYQAAVTSLGKLAAGGQGTDQGLDANGRLLYSIALFSVGRFAEAAKAFVPIEARAMQDPRSAYSWAFSLAHSGDPARANAIAAQLEKEPLDPPVLSLVCHIFMDTESYEQSTGCYRSLIASNPAFPLAHYQVGESLIRLDKPGDAIPELRQELTLNPDDPNVQYSLAFALLQTSKKAEATMLLSKLTSEHPDMAQPQYQLAKLESEAGNLNQAITHFELAEKSDPGADYIHYQLQGLYRKVGRADDAEREMQLYRSIKARRRGTPSSR